MCKIFCSLAQGSTPRLPQKNCEQPFKIDKLILENYSVFAKDKKDVGKTNKYEARTDL